MILIDSPMRGQTIAKVSLSLGAALLLAFALVPLNSCAYPDSESASPYWIASKNPAGASRPISSYFVPDSNGIWQAEIQNDGLRSMVLEVYNQSRGGTKILHQNILFSKFDAYPSGVVKSETCDMSMGSTYEIVSKGFGGPRGSSAIITSEFYPYMSKGLVLDEGFTSWQTLDHGWSFWNLTVGGYRSWFDVSGGLMLATSNDVLVHGDFVSYANWTHQVTCDDSITISFDICLPADSDQKSGWAGQVFWFVIYDSLGVPMVTSRFVMDSPWDTAHVGWVYWAGSEIAEICAFNAGWHQITYELQNGSDTWTAVFDGAAYEGLSLSTTSTVTSDIGMIQFQNSLREEVQVVLVDNLRVESA